MMAIVARHERLARSRAGLYDQVLSVLCYGWDLRKELSVEDDSLLRDLGPEEKKRLLRAVAWRMQAAEEGLRANAIAEPELLATLEAQLASEFPRADPGRRKAAARRLVCLLQERNWMLTLRGPALYGFVHRTFLEHLCASELLRRWQEREIETEELIRDHLLARAGDDSWREVIRLVAAQLPPKVVARLLSELLPTAEKTADRVFRLVLAFQCIAEQEPRRLPELAEPCAKAMRTLYAFLREGLLELAPREDARQIARALREVGPAWPNGPALLDELGWRKLTTPTADTILADSIILPALAAGPFREHPRLRAMLLDELAGDDPSVRQCVIRALAARFPGDAEIGSLLCERAVEDPSPEARAQALRALAQNFRETPETLPLLRARAVEDWDSLPRVAALEALAGYFRDEPEVPKLLRHRAVEDPSSFVRVSVLEMLAKYFPASPETAPFLRRRAVDDHDADLCYWALDTLGRHFSAAPETLPFLRQRAVEDPHPSLRATALRWLAHASALSEAELLLSRNSDGLRPFLDPREPVTEERVRKAAAKLGLPEAEVRRRYEELAEQLPITLAWRAANGGDQSTSTRCPGATSS